MAKEKAAVIESVKPALELRDKPSIAVLPFTNMSGDPEQEYFSDGITEDIITALSHFRELLVIARNTSFSFKGKAMRVDQICKELNVSRGIPLGWNSAKAAYRGSASFEMS